MGHNILFWKTHIRLNSLKNKKTVKKGFSISNYKQCTSEFNKKQKKKFFQFFFQNTYPVPNFRLNPIKNKKKFHNFRTDFFSILHWKKRFWDFQKKWWIGRKTKKKKDDFWYLIFKNSRTYGNFEICVPPPPTWHQILKPIRMLVTIFYYLYK